MLSIAKINAEVHQAKGGRAGYAHYLGPRTTRQRGDFDDYARGAEIGDIPPFWACKGPALLGLDGFAEAEQVERLARGFHPVTGEPLVDRAGDGHVMGLDMTFSAPKDVSAVFAGADSETRAALIEALQESARAALGYAEASAVTRHGRDGRVKQIAEAAVAAVYTHLSSRAGDPQMHCHGFFLNVGKRLGGGGWSALEHRTQFDRKLATGILFRAELASRVRALGFGVVPVGPYFAIRGIGEEQRDALSTRSRQIADYMRERGLHGSDSAMRDIAALNSRAEKDEPTLPELLARFEAMAGALGITPASVAAMRGAPQIPEEAFSIDHAALLDELVAQRSCATAQEALALICEKAMGRWGAAECLAEAERFMGHEGVVHLGLTEHLTRVFTSKATRDLERSISERVEAGKDGVRHRAPRALVDREFDRLECELAERLGVPVSMAQQRAAAMHVVAETGDCAFVEGWAGTGKTTMLRCAGVAYKEAGFSVLGCCQSAAASQNLSRETGIPSRTIASLLLSLRENRAHLHAKSIVVLDEAGMVGSREFALLQDEVLSAGGKLVCVGDPKQLQPIDAGGIFGSLMARHGKSEISEIQRQRTDFAPLLDWLDARAAKAGGGLTSGQARALREVPEEARMAAIEAVCSRDAKLSRALARWRARFDFQWLREAVELFAKGDASKALGLLDARDRLKLLASHALAAEALIDAWDADRTALGSKAIVAATRAEVAELNRMARARLVAQGVVRDELGLDVEIVHRDESADVRRFAPGDRIGFTMNDRRLGVANGVAGFVRSIVVLDGAPALEVELDDANERGERLVRIPASFGRFDHAYCLTNHKSQGRTFDSAHVLANPSMADREWTYVAASRSRFSTTIYVDASALGLVDSESHRGEDRRAKSRSAAIEALASRMRRSRAKGTSLDYGGVPDISSAKLAEAKPRNVDKARAFARSALVAARALLAARRGRAIPARRGGEPDISHAPEGR